MKRFLRRISNLIRRELPYRAKRWINVVVRKRGISTSEMSYQSYLRLQKLKTQDPMRRAKWTGEEWAPKLETFTREFSRLLEEHPHHPDRALLIGARTGQEVQAMRDLGVDAIGIDLVPHSDLVIAGDMHKLPFEDCQFDFVFSNCFDHSLFPHLMISEIERVTRAGAVIVLHLQLNKPDDKFGVTDLYDTADLKKLFKYSEVISDRQLPKGVLAMNHELVARRRAIA